MKAFSLKALILFNFLFTFTVVASEIDEMADKILAHVEQQHRLITLGEINHEEPRNIHLALQLLQKSSFQILALELPSSIQPHLDNALDPAANFDDAFDIIKTHVKYLTPEEFKKILLKIRALNQSKNPDQRLRIVGVDLHTSGFADMKTWFLSRDPHMLETLKTTTNNFNKGAIVLLGYGHTTKEQVQLPRSLQKIAQLPPQLANLGSKIEALTELRNKVLRIYLDSPLSPVARWAYLPPEYGSMHRLGKQLRSELPTTALLSTVLTDSSLSLVAATEVQIAKSGADFYGMAPTRNVDLTGIWKPLSTSWKNTCVEHLKLFNPKIFTRGVMLRWLSR